jgi:hypothetical protein
MQSMSLPPGSFFFFLFEPKLGRGRQLEKCNGATGVRLAEVIMDAGINLRPYACPNCQLNTNTPGALGNHVKSCRRKRQRADAAISAAAQASAFLTRTRDEKGRKLWLTEHNDVCENCLESGNMLLCSYCNTAWHLQCTAEAFSEAPTGDWMCGLCTEAERLGENMMQHGLEGEGDDADGAGFDPSGVDADDEDGETDVTQAAYVKAGLRPFQSDIWDASTMAALQRGLDPHPPPEETRATAIDKQLNVLKSKHGLSLSVMVGFDAILSFVMENPDETFTPARQRIKNLTEELQKVAPIVRYEVSNSVPDFATR